MSCSNLNGIKQYYVCTTLVIGIHNLLKPQKMKQIIPAILLASILFIESGCKKVVEDIIDCTIESALLSIHDEVDGTNPKLVHFEFINNDTGGDFTLDSTINWDFGDGNTTSSTGLKTDHIYSNKGNYKVTASYTLRRGSATCTGYKEDDVTIE